jgi:multicopper oxidase
MPSHEQQGQEFAQPIADVPAGQFSRRALFIKSALGTMAAALPGIVVLSSEPNALAGAVDDGKTKSKAADASKTSAASVVEYTLHAGSKQAAPDGRTREVFCYDGKIPGPLVRAKLGQKLKIKVVNDLSVPTTIHWHGMHQPGTWQMDGVDGVSQAPIPPGKEFTYEFTATPAGTHWYHSHTGVQYSDGLFGALVVDEPAPPAKYDREQIVLINDWFLQQSDGILAGLIKNAGRKSMARDAAGKSGAAHSVMVPPKSGTTGMAKSDAAKSAAEKAAAAKANSAKSGAAGLAMPGKPDVADVPFESGLMNGQGRFGNNSSAEFATIKVKHGETIRLRLISGASTYQFRFQIDGHPLTVIATDGAPMKPIEVDSLLLSPGERYDVLLKATANKSCWIRAVTLDGNEVKAVLLYSDGAQAELPAGPVAWGKRELQPEQMKSPATVELAEKPREIKLTLGGTMAPYAWNINGQEFPKADPIKLAVNQPVRFVLENPTMMDHPFHLHGHYFRVLGKPESLNLIDPVEKDSINIPAKSTMVVQWVTTNPGHWFFHCHIEWHLATGMARVIEIAEA